MNEDIAVYRYSESVLMDVLRAKVARLAAPEVFHTFRTLTRGLARNGLMPDTSNDSSMLDSSGTDPTQKMKLDAVAACV